MSKRLAVAVCLLTYISCYYPSLAQNYVYHEGAAKIDFEVSQFMKKWNLQGGSLALIKDGKLLYLQAFGNADVATPMQPDHLFRIASLSKPITAIAVLKLVESKLLQLDDKVFGNFGILNEGNYQNISDQGIKQITVKHLLQHTGGWDRNKGAEGDPMFKEDHIAKIMRKEADSETIIEYMLTKKLDFEPGTKFSYSNFGYNILGRVIEKVTNMSYEEYIQCSILAPLGIADMSMACNLYEDRRDNEVVYHVNQFEPFATKPEHFPYGTFNIEAMDAHGGWLASAIDLAKIIVASNGSGTERDVISEQSAAKMMAPGNVNENYGLGWCINKSGNRWHTGSLIGASAMMVSLKNGIGGVVLFNGNPLTGDYFESMDKMMWMAMRGVKNLPDQDLFLQVDTAGEPMNQQIHIAPEL